MLLLLLCVIIKTARGRCKNPTRYTKERLPLSSLVVLIMRLIWHFIDAGSKREHIEFSREKKKSPGSFHKCSMVIGLCFFLAPAAVEDDGDDALAPLWKGKFPSIRNKINVNYFFFLLLLSYCWAAGHFSGIHLYMKIHLSPPLTTPARGLPQVKHI